MLSLQRSYILFAIIMLVYTLLLVTPFYLGSDQVLAGPSGSVISPLFGALCLFVLVLFVIYSLLGASRKHILRLENRVAELEQRHTSAEQNHEQDMEKRFFEISVINASLNREIAERIQAENESKELHKRMELILNSAGEGIFGLDTDGTVTFANTAAAVMTGWDLDELVGQSHHDLVHHSNADATPHAPEDCLIRQAYIDGIVHFSSDDVFWTKDGTSFPVEYVSTPIIDKDKIRGAVVVFRDMSTFT